MGEAMNEFPVAFAAKSHIPPVKVHDGDSGIQGKSTFRIGVALDEAGFSHLTCECTLFQRKAFCKHVEWLYRDDTILSNHIDAMGIAGEWTPAIIVFRTPSWLVIPTVRTPLGDNSTHRVDALWGRPVVNPGTDPDGNAHIDARGGETVGYIGFSQGRKAIRELILEWLPSLWYTVDHKCPSRYHAKGSSYLDNISEYPDDEMTKRRCFVDLYYILDQSMCAQCHIAVASQAPWRSTMPSKENHAR